jgi:pimeloyl-ACP methyl ester carboxylesterase
MAYALTNGVRLHVQRLIPPAGVQPSGKTVILIHGLIMDDLSSYYFTLANPLSAAGHDVVMYDLRGHGHSDRPPTGYSVDDGVADLDGLLTALNICRPVHLVGNSYGGAIAMAMALRHPHRVADITLIEGLYADEGFGPEMAETLGIVAKSAYEQKWKTWIAERGRKTVKTAHRGVSLIETTTIQQDLLTTVSHPEASLQTMQVPVLAIYGGESEVLGRARKLANLAPNARLIVLFGLDHRVLLNAASYLSQVLRWWLTGHDGESPLWIPPALAFEPAPISRALIPKELLS